MAVLVVLITIAAVAAPAIMLFLMRERYTVLVVFGIEVVVLALGTWLFWPRPISYCPQGACDGQILSWVLAVPIALAWIVTAAAAIVRYLSLPN